MQEENFTKNIFIFFFRWLLQHDDLDFLLKASYNHSCAPFPEKATVCVQPETCGIETGRKMRNERELPVPPSIQFMFREKESKNGQVVYNDVRNYIL